jgi:hypothetical protein
VAVSFFVTSPTVFAEVPSPAVKEKCGAEIRSFCLRPWNLTPSAISECVEERRAELTPECQEFWKVASGCQKEMKSICGWKFPLMVHSCFEDSGKEFSNICRETLDIK